MSLNKPSTETEGTTATISEKRFTRALLVNPPTGLYRRDDRCQCKVEDQTVQIVFPPIELAILGAVLKENGVETRIADYPAERRDWNAYLEDLRDFQPDFVLVNIVTATSERDFQACEAAREILGENAIIAAKGEYMDALGIEALHDYPAIDIGFHGEIETVLQRYHSGEPLNEIAGIIWRDEYSGTDAARIHRNPGHPTDENLDELPWPDRSLLRNEIYVSPESGKPLTVIHGNRGCPAACIFCPAGVMSGFRVRHRSPENILAEIRECVEVHGIREFLFHGDTFTLNKKWLLELCALIRDSGLDIRWGCNSRVDTMDAERASAMREAGCWVVAFGVETGNQEILDKMKKGAKVEQAREAVSICRTHGLKVHTFFVIGLPWETEETLEETYRFAVELDPDFFDFNIAYPLPGTEFYEIAVAENLYEQDPESSGYAQSAVRTYKLKSEYLTAWRRKRLLSMYLRPKYIARTLITSGSPAKTLNYLRAGAKRLTQLITP